MKIKIEIDCDDDLQDLKTHLSVIREQTVKAFKRAEKDNNWDSVSLSDNNCYGSHQVDIEFTL